MKRIIGTGSRVSRSEYLYIQNASNTSGSGLTALTAATAGLAASYTRSQAAASLISLIASNCTAAYLSGGFSEVSQVGQPGLYRIDVPDAALATGVDKTILYLQGGGMVPNVSEYQVDTDISLDPAFGISARGTINKWSGSGTTNGALSGLVSGSLPACSAGDLLWPIGFQPRVMQYYNSSNGSYFVESAWPSTVSGVGFRVMGVAPGDSTQLVYAQIASTVSADIKKINGTTVAGNGGTTPWGP
jgi:hypothetical protein